MRCYMCMGLDGMIRRRFFTRANAADVIVIGFCDSALIFDQHRTANFRVVHTQSETYFSFPFAQPFHFQYSHSVTGYPAENK